jgi:ariadne-1
LWKFRHSRERNKKKKKKDFFLFQTHSDTVVGRSFESLDEVAILSESKALISNIQEVCGLPSPTMAALLLRTHEWNKERLIERWMEDSAAVLKKAGISSGDLVTKPKKLAAKLECPICLDDTTNENSYALGCGHRYCTPCWTRYLTTALQSAHTAVSTRCPFPKCGALVHDDAFRQHLSKQDYARYEQFVRRSFVDSNPKAKWCPAPGCSRAVRVDAASRRAAVRCSCGLSFCFSCCDGDIGDHSPATCADVEAWLSKASSESENLTWLAANTKKCPKCSAFIEKNGGCMHMTCSKAGCGFEFCWLCRGSWKEHGSATGGYYKCNKYEKNKDAADKEEAQQRQAKTELEHYMFYYHRYESHRNARRVADTQRVQCAEKEAAVLAKFGVRSADTKFMLEAVEQLLHCRRILEYSYMYGYYLSAKQGAERNLFEYLQEDVEKHTNELSEQYERDLRDLPDYAAFMAWKERVTNLTRVCGKFVANFCSGVERGLTSQ